LRNRIKNAPWFIVGVGRSGTSTVARIMHEHFKVSMGGTLVPADDANPKGYYEDVSVHYENRKLTRGMGSFPDWFYYTQKEIAARYATEKPWGLKVNGLTYLLGMYDTFCPKINIIWPIRKFPLVVNSFCTWWVAYSGDKGRELAKTAIKGKMISIGRLLKNRDHLKIYFNERRRTDEEIIEQIQTKWPELNRGGKC